MSVGRGVPELLTFCALPFWSLSSTVRAIGALPGRPLGPSRQEGDHLDRRDHQEAALPCQEEDHQEACHPGNQAEEDLGSQGEDHGSQAGGHRDRQVGQGEDRGNQEEDLGSQEEDHGSQEEDLQGHLEAYPSEGHQDRVPWEHQEVEVLGVAEEIQVDRQEMEVRLGASSCRVGGHQDPWVERCHAPLIQEQVLEALRGHDLLHDLYQDRSAPQKYVCGLPQGEAALQQTWRR